MGDKNKIKSQLFIIAMIGRMFVHADEWEKRCNVAGYNEEDIVLTIKNYAVAVVEECEEWLKQPYTDKG